jgi:NAD(P)-dependent dehydrogenase (short-subunit alcohol dehydrogenase family)
MIGAGKVPVYATAKAGVEGLTRALAHELGPSGIRVNSIAPGWVLTERQLAKGREDPGKFAAYLERQFLKEHLQPEDVAELALWLSAGESRLCTAHTWFVDAGACSML